MPRIVSRDEIAARLRAKGQTEEQIAALFLAYDEAAKDRAKVDQDAIARLLERGEIQDPRTSREEYGDG